MMRRSSSPLARSVDSLVAEVLAQERRPRWRKRQWLLTAIGVTVWVVAVLDFWIHCSA